MADPVVPTPSVAPAVVVVYSGFVGAAWLWLWLRERTDRLPASAFGEVGALGSLAVGIGVGLAVTGISALLVRYSPRFAGLEHKLAQLLGPLSDRDITIVALFSALGEEFLFRLAMQDALGLWPTAVAFGLLHLGPPGTRLWTASALVVGILFGWLVDLGCGLLAVTTAHAIINYASLRRMNAR